MNATRLFATAAALLAIGCTDGGDPLAPAVPDNLAPIEAEEHISAISSVPVAGAFEAQVDFSTLTLTPKGRRCLLVVGGQLVFSGTIEGVATGTTTALVFAPCSEVSANPPGTHRDVFRSDLVFEGLIDGESAQGRMTYLGSAEPGGHIEALLILSHGLSGVLSVDGQVAVGGSYEGRVLAR